MNATKKHTAQEGAFIEEVVVQLWGFYGPSARVHVNKVWRLIVFVGNINLQK